MDEVRRNVADIRSEGAVGSFPVGYYLTGLAADEETFSTAGVVVLPDEFVVVDTDLERDDRWEIGRIPRTGTVTSVKPLPEGAAVPNLKAGEKPKEPDLEEQVVWFPLRLPREDVVHGLTVGSRLNILWTGVGGRRHAASFAFATEEGAREAEAKLHKFLLRTTAAPGGPALPG